MEFCRLKDVGRDKEVGINLNENVPARSKEQGYVILHSSYRSGVYGLHRSAYSSNIGA